MLAASSIVVTGELSNTHIGWGGEKMGRGVWRRWGGETVGSSVILEELNDTNACTLYMYIYFVCTICTYFI